MKRSFVFCVAILVSSLARPCETKIIHVPADSSTIQAGINGAVDGDTVLVARGRYYERINFLGKEILVGSNFIFDSDTVTVDSTIIHGEGSGSVVFFYCSDPSVPRLVGLTITNGNAADGGGIWCVTCAPVVANNKITGNQASQGGGIYCADYYSPIIVNNRIRNNTAEWGGGIWCEAMSRAIVRGNDISGNQVTEYGGGFGSSGGSSIVIAGNSITGNSAGSIGGGIYLQGSHGLIDSNTVSGNDAVWGGGFGCWTAGSFGLITNTVISHNTSQCGGGLFFGHFTRCSLSDNLIISNIALEYGGGISCWDMYEGTITRNTIDGNFAGYLAGGIDCGNSPILITHNVISNSPDGEGIVGWEGSYHYPTISYNNVWNNLDGNFYDCSAGVGDMTWGTNVNGEPCDSFFNVSCPPLFCFPDTGDYYLAENSCCVGAGEAGVDIGAFGVGCPAYVLGDVNRDGLIDIVDLVDLIDYLYRGAPAPNALPAGDTNYDGQVNLADIVCLLNYVLRGGSLPC